MKTVIEESARDSVLAQWRGANAKILMFHVTHNRLLLILSRPDDPEVLYVVAIGCEHIRGPFSWSLSEISIAMTEIDGVARCEISDANAGFQLACSSAALARGPAGEFPRSFESFLS